MSKAITNNTISKGANTMLNTTIITEALVNLGFKKVEAVTVTKNGVQKTGMRYYPEGSNVCPTVYIDDLTEDEAIDTCKQLFSKPIPVINNNPFEDFDKSRLFARVYRKGFSGSDLTREILDLEVVAAYRFDFEDGKGSCTLTKAHAESIGLDADELIETALKNSFNDCKVWKIGDLLAKLMPNQKFPDGDMPMFVLTSLSGAHGASNLLNTKTLSEIAESVGNDLFVLPSSIHEVIAIPAIGNANEVRTIVQTINASEVEADEVLSDSVYRFNSESKQLNIA